jgi:amino acid transporter
MSAGLASLACYSIFEASLTGLFAFFGNSFFNTYFGVNIGWIWFALFMIIVAGLLSYREVKLSAQILGIALILEILILALFALGVMFAGTSNFSGEALNVFNVTVPVAEQKVGDLAIPAGAAAVGIFMAFWSWVGFEMAPNYAEESRDPKHIIPRSLYISVIGLGLFYILVSWCAVSAYPTEGEMLAKAFSDSGNFYMTPLENIYGGWAKFLLGVLILTSSFACGMAFHNTAARYMYSLAREGVLPASIAETHDHHKSPHKASVVQTVLAAIWVILFAFFNGTDDPNAQAFLGVYTLFAVLGTGLLLVLQAIVSLAIFNWFRKNGGGGVFTTVIAPLFSVVVQLWLVYLLVANLATFAGTSAFANAIPWIMLVILALGLIWGFVLKSSNPKAYQNIGHMVNDLD